ncbi:MAG: ABC transporter ATP-binding protein [Pseudomonadota bacterium]
MLELDALDIGYRSRSGNKSVAGQINLELDAGEFVCLLGPNGAGKSTLMRTIAGMQPPLDGRVRVGGRNLQEMSARERAEIIGVVLTEKVTAGLLTSYAFVSLGRYPYTKWSGKLSEHDHRIVWNAISMAGAVELADRFVGELSDGERQRVTLARALAQQPRLLILDEMTAFLDLPRRVEIMALLRQIARDTGCAMLASTHELDLALRNADRVWLLGTDGNVRHGAPEDLVLAGDFAATFNHEGMDFDPLRGALYVRQRSGPEVLLCGERSVRLEWTQRALERCGFRLRNEETPGPEEIPRVEVLGDDGWQLNDSGTAQSFGNLYELTRALTYHAEGKLR